MFESLKNSIASIKILKFSVIGIPFYKWLISALILLFFLVGRKLFLLIVIKAIERFTRRTRTDIDDRLVRALSKPASLLFVVLGVFFSMVVLEIKYIYVLKILRSFFVVLISWGLYNLVIEFQDYIYRICEKFGKEVAKEIGSFVIKFLKVSIIVLAVLSLLQEWGINVSAVIASLGIGGLAVALAAKDTVANLFGGLTVLIDKSMKVGDWIKLGNVEGIVEDIGLRTTKIRSFEKSLIVVPNQVLANESLENFSRRKVRRIKMVIGLTYDTSREKMIKILNEIRSMLKSHPGIAKDQLLMVYFTDFGDSSLNIFIYCFTNTADWEKYLAIREDVNLKIMEIVERNGASFAFPSTSIYVEKWPESPFPMKIEKPETLEKEETNRNG